MRVLIGGFPAPLVSIAPGEIDAIVPNDLARAGTATGLVAKVGRLFTLDDSGAEPGAILNSDIRIKGENNRAKAGSMVVLYATGQGLSTDPAEPAGAIVNSPSLPKLSVTVTIAGEPARILFAGRHPD